MSTTLVLQEAFKQALVKYGMGSVAIIDLPTYEKMVQRLYNVLHGNDAKNIFFFI